MKKLAILIALFLAFTPSYAVDLTGTIGGGGGGGGSGTVTSIATGCQATGGTITTTGTISTQFTLSATSPVTYTSNGSNATYAILAADSCHNLVLSTGITAATLAVASTSGYGNGVYWTLTNATGVSVNLSITTSTLNGYSSLNLAPGAVLSFNSDGSNYWETGFSGAVSLQIGSSTGNTLTPYSGYFICTTTCTVTPPLPQPGFQFCVMNDDNVGTVITLGALGSSSYYENTARTAYGTAGTGTLSSGGAKADMACIVGRDSTHYLTPTYVGTWTAS